MSIKVMSAVWERKDLDASERLVMLSLADHADDEGMCYPSIRRLEERTSLKARAIQSAIKRLCERGFLSINYNAGRNGSNLFTINATPAFNAPPHLMHPASDAPPPPHLTHQTPAANAPKPSRTIIEPPEISKGRAIVAELEAWASSDAVASFMAYRRKSKGKALTLTGAKRLAGNLRAIFNANGDPDDALGMAEERGWLTVEPDWYFRAKGNQNDNRTSNSRPTGRSGMVDAFAAVAAQRSGHT